MGLDMYLNRMPRYKEVTASQVNAIENWFDYEERPEKYADCAFKEWCGCREQDLPDKETIEYFRSIRTFNYHHWDTEKKYGCWRIIEQVGYWRKANEIHNWFVENVQDGEDDCCYHNEVTEELLEKLRDTCQEVLDASKLVPGKIYTGTSYQNGMAYQNYEDGLVVENESVARELLPTADGFFFGGINYDEWYVNDLKETIEIIDKVLEETDFETQMIYYVSSW